MKIQIISSFIHDNKRYILFTQTNSKNDALYIQDEYLGNISLLAGPNLSEKISEIRKDSNACIECSLGTKITHGISKDGRDLVEFGFKVEQANEILSVLRHRLVAEKEEKIASKIKYFERQSLRNLE